MTYGYPEMTVGGVLFAPFVQQGIVALVIFFLMRPLYRLLPMDRLFSNPPLIGLCLFICILALVMVVM